MPKDVKKKKVSTSQRHDPLDKQLAKDEGRHAPKVKKQKKQREVPSDEEVEDFLPSAVSKRILQEARAQQNEMEEEIHGAPKKKGVAFEVAGDLDDDTLDEETGVFDESEAVDADGFVEGDNMDLTEEDERALAMFMGGGAHQKRSLTDIIMGKIQEKESGAGNTGPVDVRGPKMDPKIIQVYTSVGKLLHHYSSGKMPKAFKIIPALSNWEEILYYTKPEEWSPNAMHQATRIFASNLNPRMAQRFYNLVLLPAVRDDIGANKKLNWHYYMALKKALYKPAAWFKGILLPICEEQDCSLREAAIIGSVLTKVSVPVVHSSAALMKIADMEYSPANSYFMRILFNKKYALPIRVLHSVVEHFARFTEDSRKMTVLWHQALLAFAQRYKDDLTPEQRDKLKYLMRNQTHHQITAEVRRELFSKHGGADAMDVSATPQAVSMEM
eukprot:GILK01002660.1.p1 GENE.GILK01002660.1~~GILK01002660.1.p1  ORF type:complete len:458 (-),score=109.82 GILK01002660.1:152-1477(-)